MTDKDILNIVLETFNEEISSDAVETLLGIESYITGKEDFMKSLECKLKKLLEKDKS